ncbi:sigma-70 family RNA polymerase sigma factor [Smaragdicoccus niigatensis]|uniref:sigma-70 family RNA polymerase sigma factor n=1 Tax=Smaragdicoccus niigatensis TaxID=359359 RepID=UPI0003821637|nr:sigma-70 family RNA polymerase sigma factor [Smaragdicoccus niigatensis]
MPENSETEWLTNAFEAQRPRLRGVAYRVLGSLTDADDAVQEAWLRVSRSDTEAVENLSAWLTTVVGRISLNMLRARTAHPNFELDETQPSLESTPQEEAVLADSVGLALMVVLDTLSPAERLSFVLHDMFDLPFDEIATIVGRTPDATRQLASRARRRVRGGAESHSPDFTRRRRVVDGFIAATRSGDLDALIRLLDPEVTIHADATAAPTGREISLRGRKAVSRGALASTTRAGNGEVAMIDGKPGIVVAPGGHLWLVLTFEIEGDAITHIEVVGEAERLAGLTIATV